MLSFIHKHWHCWGSSRQLLLSNEETKKLYTFCSTAEVINWLATNGEMATAKALHKHIKAQNERN
jgi:hypothetical protein